MKEYLQNLFRQLFSNSDVSEEPDIEILSNEELQELFADTEYCNKKIEDYREAYFESKNKFITELLLATGIDFKGLDDSPWVSTEQSAFIKLPEDIIELRYAYGSYSVKRLDCKTPEEWYAENQTD